MLIAASRSAASRSATAVASRVAVAAAPALLGENDEQLGREIYALAAELYPICRSITGNGVRQTLDILGTAHRGRASRGADRHARSSTGPIPREWTIRAASIKDAAGERVVDFRDSNLHVLNYSAPVRRHAARAS